MRLGWASSEDSVSAFFERVTLSLLRDFMVGASRATRARGSTSRLDLTLSGARPVWIEREFNGSREVVRSRWHAPGDRRGDDEFAPGRAGPGRTDTFDMLQFSNHNTRHTTISHLRGEEQATANTLLRYRVWASRCSNLHS